VSGGIDSALVAAIAQPVCQSLGIKLIGRSLPQSTNKKDEIKRAKNIGNSFCTDFKIHIINKEVSKLLNACETDYGSILYTHTSLQTTFNKIAEGNVKARTRMILLYDLAYRTQGIVLGTDNLTEFLLGFWTMHGDVGDYGMIQNLWKTEVYDLAEWVCENELRDKDDYRYVFLKDCIKAVPTDGLGITNSDLDQLGAPTYLEVDNILKAWLTENIIHFRSFSLEDYLNYSGRLEDPDKFFKYRLSLKNHPVVQRHIKSEFKRNNPINLKRDLIFKRERGRGKNEFKKT
jgi:NAD+ synthetase